MRAFRRIIAQTACTLILAGVVSLMSVAAAQAAATITIINNDVPGVGFNDSTVAAPIGGNPGFTVGQQRLNAFVYAGNIWAARLTSSVTIRVRAQFQALSCTATSATLGTAGTTVIFRDFANAPLANTWYSKAEANSFAMTDLDATTPDINAIFNVNLGNTGCMTGTHFYLGLDNNHGSSIDLVTVLLHELAHGLGFQSYTNPSTGNYLNGSPSVYDYFVHDDTTNKNWTQMTPAERVASALNARHVAWTGSNVQAAAPAVLAWGYPRVIINAPASIAGIYEVGTASFGPPLSKTGISANVVIALDGAGSTTDACSPITNPNDVAGNIALVDRGNCNFDVKVKNAQDAGAVAVIVVDNVAGTSPPGLAGSDASIVIPSVRISMADGAAIKATRLSGVDVSATLDVDNYRLAGANASGQPLLYTPNPFSSGATISHWDISVTPNLLMEPPPFNSDLGQSVLPPQDLTAALLRDIGWTTVNYTFTVDRIFTTGFD